LFTEPHGGKLVFERLVGGSGWMVFVPADLVSD